MFKQNSIDTPLFLKLLLAIVEGKLFKKLCAPFLITYTMVSGNLFPHACTPTHNTLPKKKKKSYVACFLGYKSILCQSVAYKNINPKELSPPWKPGEMGLSGTMRKSESNPDFSPAAYAEQGTVFSLIYLWPVACNVTVFCQGHRRGKVTRIQWRAPPGLAHPGPAALPQVAQLIDSRISASPHFFNTAKPSACTETACQLQICYKM